QYAALYRHTAAFMARSPGTLPLSCHFRLKTLAVYGQAMLGSEILGQIERESIRIIQLEGIRTADHCASFILGLLADLRENCQSITQRFVEPLFLRADYLLNEIPFRHDIAVIAAHDITNRLNEVVHKRLIETQCL